MDSPFVPPFPPTVWCGLRRDCIDELPSDLTSVESALLRESPPARLMPHHSGRHLVSFARHLGELFATPVRKVATAAGIWYTVLGVVVLFKESDGTFRTAAWHVEDAAERDELRAPTEYPGSAMAIVHLPSTPAWLSHLSDAFLSETLARTDNSPLAVEWAGWAWSRLQRLAIDPIDLRRLRSRIRAQLDLDWRTVSLMQLIRRPMPAYRVPTVAHYNLVHRNRERGAELYRQSPLMAALWLALIPDKPGDDAAQPAQQLRQACRRLRLLPAQWRLLADPRAPLMPVLASYLADFVGQTQSHPIADFVGLIRVLRPRAPIDTETWRTLLSLAGTRSRAPESYASALGSAQNTLRHLIRLIEAGKAPADPARRNAELHQIGAWIADKGVLWLSKQHRRAGWPLLVRRARQYAIERRRAIACEEMRCPAPFRQVTGGGFSAVALSNGRDLWEESMAMRHCADRYAQQCSEGTMRIYSIRRADGTRHATVALEYDEGTWRLFQASGPANRRVGDEVLPLVDVLLDLSNAPVPLRDAA